MKTPSITLFTFLSTKLLIMCLLVLAELHKVANNLPKGKELPVLSKVGGASNMTNGQTLVRGDSRFYLDGDASFCNS
uniref:Uncharacterized protein n=1 Tax=Seriola dumerili TaxID=41447 RepID=A0A3B4UGI8_SERDU